MKKNAPVGLALLGVIATLVSTLISTIIVTLLVGCTSFSPDGGFDPVSKLARERIGKELIWSKSETDQNTIAARVSELLRKPLSVDDSVQIALLNNRGLQADFAELAISESDLVQAGRITNPSFRLMRAKQNGNLGSDYKIEQAISLNIFSLVTMPQRMSIERRQFEQTQARVSLAMLRLAAETRKAYFNAVAAEESLRYANQIRSAAEAGAELARRMQQVGNFNKLQQAREQAFYAEAMLGVLRAEQSSLAHREHLTRLLGLSGDQIKFELPERLPDLPEAVIALNKLEQMALNERIDVKMARLQTEALSKNLGLGKATRFINVLEMGLTRSREGASDAAFQNGYEVSLELPLFDWGSAKVAKAEARYMQSLNITAQTAINARSEVNEAYQAYRSSFEIARHYRDEIVPLKKRISEENLLRYNGMFIGVFELLADARTQIVSVNSAIEALRDFWIAQADLEMAMIGKPNLASNKRGMPVTDSD